jgi:hypothetical protein
MEVHPDQNQDDRGCYHLPSLLGYHIPRHHFYKLTAVTCTHEPFVWYRSCGREVKEVGKSYEAIKLERKNG